ncbi:MAG TPA: hypothetical protein VFP64_01990 [Pyrinomonadaceae bacterium]|nr:hypothetical protein [Pyrinomonadaceae bacterium]
MTTKKRAAKASKKAAKAPQKRSARAALSVATNARKGTAERVQALVESPAAILESDENLQQLLQIVRNTEEPPQVRLEAIDALATAAFAVATFEPYRNDYIATLQEVVDDPNLDIRERALGLLAAEKNKFVQKKLLDGLKNPEKALVPPEKALQLLSYDVHTEAYAAARDIVSNPPNDLAKQEALRLLAADPNSTKMFEDLLRDKDEKREVRQVAASALNSLAPQRLQEHAREILLDDSDYEDIQATSLTAVRQFGDEEAVAQDEKLMKSVNRMSTGAKSAKYKKSAKQFLETYTEKEEK